MALAWVVSESSFTRVSRGSTPLRAAESAGPPHSMPPYTSDVSMPSSYIPAFSRTSTVPLSNTWRDQPFVRCSRKWGSGEVALDSRPERVIVSAENRSLICPTFRQGASVSTIL